MLIQLETIYLIDEYLSESDKNNNELDEDDFGNISTITNLQMNSQPAIASSPIEEELPEHWEKPKCSHWSHPW